jgi:hypothetical protein
MISQITAPPMASESVAGKLCLISVVTGEELT